LKYSFSKNAFEILRQSKQKEKSLLLNDDVITASNKTFSCTCNKCEGNG